jgi:flagellar hook assembly protein FlgD
MLLLNGEVATISYDLAIDSNVRISIYPPTGSSPCREYSESQVAGSNAWLWDGKDNSGDYVTESGTYRVEIQAIDYADNVIEKQVVSVTIHI